MRPFEEVPGEETGKTKIPILSLKRVSFVVRFHRQNVSRWFFEPKRTGGRLHGSGDLFDSMGKLVEKRETLRELY